MNSMPKASWFFDNTPIFINKLQKVHFTTREFSLASIFQQIYRWSKKTVERVHYYKF